MKQYNRIMLGEGGKYLKDCLDNNYIGANFLRNIDLSAVSNEDEDSWRQRLVAQYLKLNPDKSVGTARTSVGFLWTICYGLKVGDIVLASNGQGGYCVAEIVGEYHYAQGKDLPHRRSGRWLDIVIPRRSMSQKLQNSTGSIGTCCNITKYADELEKRISGAAPSAPVLEDVKGDLQKFCDRGFSSQEEILAYCRENHIPC